MLICEFTLIVQLYKRRHRETMVSKKTTYTLYRYFSGEQPFFPIFFSAFYYEKLQTCIKAERLPQWTSVCPSPFYGNPSFYLFYPPSICLAIPLDNHQAILVFWCIWNYIADVRVFSPKHFIMPVMSWRSVFIYNIILMMQNRHNLKGKYLQCIVCVCESMPLCCENS